MVRRDCAKGRSRSICRDSRVSDRLGCRAEGELAGPGELHRALVAAGLELGAVQRAGAARDASGAGERPGASGEAVPLRPAQCGRSPTSGPSSLAPACRRRTTPSVELAALASAPSAIDDELQPRSALARAPVSQAHLDRTPSPMAARQARHGPTSAGRRRPRSTSERLTTAFARWPGRPNATIAAGRSVSRSTATVLAAPRPAMTGIRAVRMLRVRQQRRTVRRGPIKRASMHVDVAPQQRHDRNFETEPLDRQDRPAGRRRLPHFGQPETRRRQQLRDRSARRSHRHPGERGRCAPRSRRGAWSSP